MPHPTFRRSRWSAALVAAAGALLLSGSAPAVAAEFVVTKTADTRDGTCDADCSLREAVEAASAAPDADVITLAAGGYDLTLWDPGNRAAGGDLAPTGDVTIRGAGPAETTVRLAVDPDDYDEVFDVRGAGTRVTLEDFTITGGNQWGLTGGGISASNGADLTLRRMVVRENASDYNAGWASGGGIHFNGNALHIEDSALLENTADWGGALAMQGGSAVVVNTTFTRNTGAGHRGRDLGQRGVARRAAARHDRRQQERRGLRRRDRDEPVQGHHPELGRHRQRPARMRRERRDARVEPRRQRRSARPRRRHLPALRRGRRSARGRSGLAGTLTTGDNGIPVLLPQAGSWAIGAVSTDCPAADATGRSRSGAAVCAAGAAEPLPGTPSPVAPGDETPPVDGGGSGGGTPPGDGAGGGAGTGTGAPPAVDPPVSAPPAPAPAGPAAPADLSAPKLVLPKRLAVDARRKRAALTLSCPAGETRCVVAARLERTRVVKGKRRTRAPRLRHDHTQRQGQGHAAPEAHAQRARRRRRPPHRHRDAEGHRP